MAERPNACSVCNKRLNRRHWYYRENGYFCSKACWHTAEEKAATAQAEHAKQDEAKADAPKEEAKPATAAGGSPAEGGGGAAAAA